MIRSIQQAYWIYDHDVHSHFKPRHFLESLNEQTPHLRLCSILIASLSLMQGGNPVRKSGVTEVSYDPRIYTSISCCVICSDLAKLVLGGGDASCGFGGTDGEEVAGGSR